MDKNRFPNGFLWGASTSAYQVEGGLKNQWSEWEHANAKRLAAEGPKKLAWLPHQEQIAASLASPDNYVSSDGVEHYERYEDDFDLLEQLNLNTFRFGIEWSRLEPEEGVWDEAALQHYRDYIGSLKRRGIEPILTLWHWTMPLWFVALGGFEKSANLTYWQRYVQKIADELSSDLHYVITLNEPNVYTAISYLVGEWPPQRKNPLKALQVYKNLVRAHKVALSVLKQPNNQLQVGIAHNFGEILPSNKWNPLNWLVVWLARYMWNWWFLDRIKNACDFIGVNWYHTEYKNWLGRSRNPAAPVSDLGWYMEPSNLANVLIRTWQRFRKPLIITENGLADATDTSRKWWIQESLAAMQDALAQKVRLIGYLHWSLLDNFEWSYGWWPKFGLVAVDRKHGMKRTIRASATWFADQIKRIQSE